MNNVKVVKVQSDEIEFDNGVVLFSDHDSSCCEEHYLSFADLSLVDFDGLLFDLSNDKFFERVEGYGIRLIPINGHPVSVPGYAENNGYYSDNLSLQLTDRNGFDKVYDITECQCSKGYY